VHQVGFHYAVKNKVSPYFPKHKIDLLYEVRYGCEIGLIFSQTKN